MDKQKTTLFALAGVGGIILIGLAVLLYFSISNMMDAHKARDKAYTEFESYYRKPAFPNRENIDRRKADVAAFTEWSDGVVERIEKGNIQVEDETIVGFKTRLQDDVRALTATEGAHVRPGLTFGFDYYLGASNEMPRQENIARLARQFAYIEQISKVLFKSGIEQLNNVARLEFDRIGGGSSGEEVVRSRRRRGDDGESSSGSAVTVTPTAPLPTALTGQLGKETFIFEFEASYPALATVINDLTKADLFTAVTDLRVTRSKSVKLAADERIKRLETLHSTRSNQAETPGADVIGQRPQDRIITNPEKDSPLKIVMKVDVYSVEGAPRAN